MVKLIKILEKTYKNNVMTLSYRIFHKKLVLGSMGEKYKII